LFRAEEDSWSDFVDALLSDDEGLVAVLRAHIDASSRDETGLFAVSGYLIESGQSRRFRQQWRATFGDAPFSWADLVARSQQFEGITHPEKDALIKAGVGHVREHFIAGAVVSCWNQDVQRFSPRWIRGWGNAYSLCCHICATAIGHWAKQNNYKGGIAYILEAGDDYHSEAEHLLSYAAKVDVVRDAYQWRSHGFHQKDAGSPFHAPDLLAWEWGKYWTETVVQKKRLIRLSLVHLLKDNLHRYKFQHLGGDPLLKFFNQIHELGVEQLQENEAAASAVSPVDLTDAVESSEPKEPVGDPE